MLRIAPVVTIGLLAGPVAFGLVYIIAPALGYAPLFGHTRLSLEPFAMALSAPGIGQSVWLSLWIGPVTALISLVVVALFTAAFSGSPYFAAIMGLMKPVLAVPHAAAAFGLAFLIAPSGFLLRLISPEVSGFDRPPDWLIVNDPNGWALLFGLVLKEIPYLFLVVLAALPQADMRAVQAAQTFGHGKVWGWMVAVFPVIYAQIRLPVYAVIAFASSVVDVALILGPGTPPPLAVQVLRWMNDPELEMRLTAAAAALLQLMITVLALAAWWLGEQLVRRTGAGLAVGGYRFCHDGILKGLGALSASGTALIVLLGIGVLALWSVAGLWRFPDAMPASLDFRLWGEEAGNIAMSAMRAAWIALAASAIATVLVIACLENEYRRDLRLSARAQLILFLPLLVPQIAFLPGLSILFLRLGIDGALWAVILAHLVFVLPYVYLTLADPWNAFDKRYLAAGRLLGHGANRVLFSIRLPMLLRPVLTAFALGFAVSIAQYLPTLLIGAGRQPTITTEAVALASGGDRRLIGAYGLVQTILPLIPLVLAGLIPALLWRNRRALRPGAV